MAVIVIHDTPGATAAMAQGLKASGVLDELAQAPGFVSHISGPTDTGYRVIEVWDTQASHEHWYDTHVAPMVPPGIEPATPQYLELTLETTAVALA